MDVMTLCGVLASGREDTQKALGSGSERGNEKESSRQPPNTNTHAYVLRPFPPVQVYTDEPTPRESHLLLEYSRTMQVRAYPVRPQLFKSANPRLAHFTPLFPHLSIQVVSTLPVFLQDTLIHRHQPNQNVTTSSFVPGDSAWRPLPVREYTHWLDARKSRDHRRSANIYNQPSSRKG